MTKIEPMVTDLAIVILGRIDFADAKSISYMEYEILQKIKHHRNQRIYRVFCGCFFEFQKIATTTLWKTNFVCMFHTRDALARLSYVAVHRFAGDNVSTCGVCVCESMLCAGSRRTA